MRTVNMIIGIICILFSVAILIMASTFTQTLVVDTGLGTEFFPRMVASGMILLAVLLIGTSLKDTTLSRKTSDVFTKEMHKSLIGMGLIVLYAVCIPLVGYLVSTVIFCFILLHFFRVHHLITKIAVSLLFSAAIYLIFSKVFLINLPTGFLI